MNVRSYPSAGKGGNNNPFDCIVNPGGGFLKIVKVANGSQTQTFSFSVTGDARGTLTKTITGNGDTGAFAVVPIASNYTVGETVPSGWQLNGASCQRFNGSSYPEQATRRWRRRPAATANTPPRVRRRAPG